MKTTLEHLVHCCHGDDRPDCPILDELADATVPPASQERAHRGTTGLQPRRPAKAPRR